MDATSSPKTVGLHCLPQLKEMIAWYGASQSSEDTVHHFEFVRGVRPDGGGYFVIDFKEVNRYLAFLRQSKFFSEKYMAAEQQSFKDAQQSFFDSEANHW
ncbi:hypothetical protein [Hymenobacter terrenus]|uniref:hypothetical protein n=1 Tax=Hymenobacter terrenus TaxID=1629124 RepID=UPI0018CD6457|nr:hypothetical protein [Hymenobacter terrenus]